MAGGNSQQRQGGTFWHPATLLPVSQSVDADPECDGELLLCHVGKPAQSDDVLAALDLPACDTQALSARDGAREVEYPPEYLQILT